MNPRIVNRSSGHEHHAFAQRPLIGDIGPRKRWMRIAFLFALSLPIIAALILMAVVLESPF